MLVLRVGRKSVGCVTSDVMVLRKRGLNCERAETGREALEYLKTYDYDVALIDLLLPDMPGYEVLRIARTQGLSTPALILADTATAQVRTKSLDQGADDFIVMPCETDELMARMRAVVRRSQGHIRSALRFGPAELDMARRELRVHGRRVLVSRREFGVLELLFLKQGVVLTKTAFLNHLYCGADEPELKTIDVIICRLRKKLAIAGVPTLIDTVWGCGYILRDPAEAIATIERISPTGLQFAVA